MKFMICGVGHPNEDVYLADLEKKGTGIELQSYGLRGAATPEAWQAVNANHRRIVSRFTGSIAVHGPFIGIRYDHMDYLLKAAVQKRLDLTFKIVRDLKPDTLVLHTGYNDDIVRLNLQQHWLDSVSVFWREEIRRYEDAGVQVVLENLLETTPDTMIELAQRVNSDYFGLCLDTGHLNVWAAHTDPVQWVRAFGAYLKHVHLHDNHGQKDDHLPVGQGTFDFDRFFDALHREVPDVTVSLEVVGTPMVIVDNLAYVTDRYGHPGRNLS